ncbi:hypothetical protein HYQ46_007130 [Verticillium longisporum]|nr:hypothetical protein HYQ46_007130 [Verticillium longisporum]
MPCLNCTSQSSRVGIEVSSSISAHAENKETAFDAGSRKIGCETEVPGPPALDPPTWYASIWLNNSPPTRA